MKLSITVGLPGSGKSTYLARLGVNAISSDEIRRLIADDPRDQSMHARVFATIRYLVRQRIAAGRPETYVDATHLTRWERLPYIRVAQRHHCEIEALYFDVPVDVCGLYFYPNIDAQFDLSCAVVWSSTMTNNDPLYTQIVNFGATAAHAVDHVQGSDTIYMRALVVHSP